MLKNISSRELSEWMAYFGVEPIDIETQYLGQAIGIGSAMHANMHKKEGTKQFEADNFLPSFKKKKKKPQSTDQMIQAAAMWTAVSGGEDKRE